LEYGILTLPQVLIEGCCLLSFLIVDATILNLFGLKMGLIVLVNT